VLVWLDVQCLLSDSSACVVGFVVLTERQQCLCGWMCSAY